MSAAGAVGSWVAVELQPYELNLAAQVGMRRQMAALLQGKRDKYGIDAREGWSVHIEGAAGELAVAKILDRYWNGSVNTFRMGGDVGTLQVRTRSDHAYELIVRRDDDEAEAFVLVTGKAPAFRVHGWIRAAEARRSEWWQTYGDRPGAWFVPQAALRPLDTLTRGRG